MPRNQAKLELFVTAIISGATQKEACAAAKIAVRTGREWMANPEVKQRIANEVIAIQSEAYRILGSLLTRSARTLDELLGPHNEPNVRLAAVRAVYAEFGGLHKAIAYADELNRIGELLRAKGIDDERH